MNKISNLIKNSSILNLTKNEEAFVLELINQKNNEVAELFEVGNKYLSNISYNENPSAERHPYHLVKPSPKPLIASFLIFLTLSHFLHFLTGIWGDTSNTNFIHYFSMVQLNYILLIVLAYTWFWYMHFEATYLGKYTRQVKRGLRLGIKLFIVSEVMFFFGAFWAYLHGALNPSVAIATVWPPRGIHMSHWYTIPTLETIVLVTSGLTLTAGYNLFLRGNRKGLIVGLLFTIIFAIYFLSLQYIELTQLLQFTIADSFFGSAFYFAVGCHALHVFLGSVALTIACIRHVLGHFYIDSHIGLQATIWYWHFVDIVWIFLYVVFYVWGS